VTSHAPEIGRIDPFAPGIPSRAALAGALTLDDLDGSGPGAEAFARLGEFYGQVADLTAGR
jgi:hypothetical protein